MLEVVLTVLGLKVMLQALNSAGDSVIAELVELAEISLPIITMKGSVVNAG